MPLKAVTKTVGDGSHHSDAKLDTDGIAQQRRLLAVLNSRLMHVSDEHGTRYTSLRGEPGRALQDIAALAYTWQNLPLLVSTLVFALAGYQRFEALALSAWALVIFLNHAIWIRLAAKGFLAAGRASSND